MFVDYAKIIIKSGNGGRGAKSFRREKYIPDGGPDGGDGGNGGDIIFFVDSNKNTLLDFTYNKKYQAESGMPGEGRLKTGKSGENLEIGVPKGTIIIDEQTGKVIADISSDEKQVILRGGRGGKGNARFKTSVRQAPNFSIDGEPGTEKKIILELKTLADVGLLGFPNVGKSTFLSRMTKARPKIANYPFTTTEPNLGVVETKYKKSFLIADIPGIIEGASKGAGLGLRFLRHVERTRLLLHFVDASGFEGRDPVEDYYKINAELKEYSEVLAKKQQILVANKIDIESEQLKENLLKLEKLAKKENIKMFKTSTATGEGLQDLIDYVGKILETIPEEPLYVDDTMRVYSLEDAEDEIKVTKIEEGHYEVTGKKAENLMRRVNLEDNESMSYFLRQIERLGIEKELKLKGVKEGAVINIAGFEFEWYE